jgi:arginine deiminase
MRNKIVVDAELRTVIAKESGFDLLNPPDPVKSHVSAPVSPVVRRRHEAQLLKESHVKVRYLRKLVHNELLQHFEKHKTKFDMILHMVSNRNIIGSIRTCIEQLAGESRLKKLDKRMKEKYAD